MVENITTFKNVSIRASQGVAHRVDVTSSLGTKIKTEKVGGRVGGKRKGVTVSGLR